MMAKIQTKRTLLLSALLATVTLVACGDGDSGTTEAPKGPDMNVVATEDLPNCTAKREGVTAFVAEDNATYKCEGNKWKIESAPISTVKTLEDLANCSSAIEGDSVIVEAEKGVFRCNEGEWKKFRTFTDTLASVDDLLACVAKREGNSTYIAEEHALYRCEDGFWEKTISFMDTVKTKDDLPNCTGKKEDDSTFVSKENAVYLCIDKGWRYLGDVTESSDNLPNCAAKREGEKSFIANEHVTLICSDGKWLSYDIYAEIKPENSPESSSSSKGSGKWEDYDPESSGSKETSSDSKKSSSSGKVSSSSAAKSSSSSLLATPCKTDSTDTCEYGMLTDERDGKTYKTVKIGSQVWMAENLDFKYTLNDGKSYGCYQRRVNESEFHLYTWAAAMDSAGLFSEDGKGCGYYATCVMDDSVRGICPQGWHLPSRSEWETLYKAMGNSPYAMQAKGFEIYRWDKATDAFGFSALPINGAPFAGFRTSSRAYNCGYNNSVAWALDSNFAHAEEMMPVDRYLAIRCVQGTRSIRSYGTMTDSRDGHVYKTTVIGEQVWMAENLNYEMDNSFCYNDLDSNCSKYGRLYTWDAAKNACPSGWHLPSKVQWNILIAEDDTGARLKANSGWDGVDRVLFSALPAGRRDSTGRYDSEGNSAYFWSSTWSSNYYAYYMSLRSYLGTHYVGLSDLGKNYGLSIRCLQN